MAAQTSTPTNVAVTAGDQSLTVTWSWTAKTNDPCPLNDGELGTSGFELQYRKTGTAWRGAPLDSANDAVNGAFELYDETVLNFTIGMGAQGATGNTLQAGAALVNGVEYQVRLSAYSNAATTCTTNQYSAYSDTRSETPFAPGSPRVTSITRTTGYPPSRERTTSNTLKWQVTFNEDVQNVDAADFTRSGTTATLAVAADGSSKTVYDVTASGGNLANLDATVTLGFASGQNIQDDPDDDPATAGNALMNTTPTGANKNSYVVDNTAPTLVSITRQRPAGSNTDADTLTWRVTFSEPVFDVWADVGDTTPSDDFNDFNVTIDPAPTNAPTLKTERVGGYDAQNGNPFYPVSNVFDLTLYGGDLATLDGTVTLTTSNDCSFWDQADIWALGLVPGFGHELACSGSGPLTPTGANDNTFVVYNPPPTVAISGVPAATGAAFTATFTFSQAVTGFEVGDITLTGATASNFTNTVPGTVWTALITPTADYSVSVAADVATDAADKGNTASDPETGTYDTTVPGITITGVPARANGAFTATFTFSMAVTDFVAGDITLTSATASSFTETVTGTVWTALITPTADYSVSVAAGVATDAADNTKSNTASATTHRGAYDTTAPTVEIVGVEHIPNTSFTVTFTFSEAMRDFVVGNITLVNAKASAFTNTVAGTAWTALITPTLDGLFYVSVEADAATDLAGNDNKGSTIHTGRFTKINPRVASIERRDLYTTAADTLTWRVTFDEDVRNVDDGDFEVSGTTATLAVAAEVVSGVTSKTVYDVTASGGDLAGLNAEVTLSFVAKPTIEGTDGKALEDPTPTGTNEHTYVVDNINPTVEITGVPATATSAFTATFTFSKTVTDFGLEDIMVTGATKSGFAGSGKTYTATITPTADYTVSVSANAATDADGNGNTASEIKRGTYTSDPTPPTVTTILRQAPASTNNDVLIWRVTFSKAVRHVDKDDFTVSGTTATVTDVANVNDSDSVYDVTATGGDLAGLNAEVTLSFVANPTIEDLDGNALSNTTATGANEHTYEVDNTAPTVTITGVPDIANEAFTATFTFSKAVTDFEKGDITLTGATASNFSGSGRTYTALITPIGAYTVSVAADVATDAAGNGNTLAEPQSGTYDPTPRALAEGLNRVILPEVARAMADQTVGAIGRRVAQARQATRTLEVGGQSTLAGVVTTHGPTLADGTLNLKGLLSHSAFVLPLQAQPGAGLSHLTLWGNGAYRNLGGEAGALDWDGDLLSARLGVDARLGHEVLAGLAVAWQQGKMDYTQTALSRQGDYDTTLTSLHPYLGWTAPDGGLDLWATAGYGWGDLTITDTTRNQQLSSDLTAQTLGAGGSSRLWATETTRLRLRGEALHTQMDIDGSATLAAQTVEARRVRLALEGSRTQALAGGAEVQSNLELGLRHDAGDGRTGTGAEVGGGLRYTDPARGLTLATQARVLLLHGGDYEDWGISGILQLEPGADGQGLAVRVQPGWGQTASRVSELWAQDAVAGLNGPPAQEGRVDVQVGYGVAWAEALVTPYGTMGLTTGRTRVYGLGGRLLLGSGLQFNLEGTRQETAGAPVDHGVRLELGLAW